MRLFVSSLHHYAINVAVTVCFANVCNACFGVSGFVVAVSRFVVEVSRFVVEVSRFVVEVSRFSLLHVMECNGADKCFTMVKSTLNRIHC